MYSVVAVNENTAQSVLKQIQVTKHCDELTSLTC